MLNYRSVGFLGLLFLSLVVAGCGGGGGSSTSPPGDALPDPSIPNIIDYYPSAGPAGSYVALLFDEPVLSDLSSHLKAYYNGLETRIAGISDDSIQVVLPLDAVSGNIEIRAGDTASNRVHFTITETRITRLAEQIVAPSPDSQTISYNDDISVTLAPGLLDTARLLSISTVENAPPSEFEPFGTSAIDISIDGLTQLDDYIEIGVRYDPARLNPDYPAEDQLIPMRWVEEEKYWLPLPYRVDTDNHIVYLATDHLSLFSVTATGLAITAAVVAIPSYIVSWAAEKLLNDVYVTPLGNFRIMYSKKAMDANRFFTERWESDGPANLTISYNPNYPKYIQDIGQVFEIGLDNFRAVGFKDPVVTPGTLWGEWRSPITVKVDSWYLTYRFGGSANFENFYQRIHLPTNELKQFFYPFGSYAVIGHELFHRMQAEYYGISGMLRFDSPANFWWIEATAEYAGSRVAWPQKYEHHTRNIQADFLSYPLDTTGLPAPHWGETLYEYVSSVFVRYLIEHKGINFQELVEFVSMGEPLQRLDEYISNIDGGSNYLGSYYADFARWSVFFPESFLSQYSTGEIAERVDAITVIEKEGLIEVVPNIRTVC